MRIWVLPTIYYLIQFYYCKKLGVFVIISYWLPASDSPVVNLVFVFCILHRWVIMREKMLIAEVMISMFALLNVLRCRRIVPLIKRKLAQDISAKVNHRWTEDGREQKIAKKSTIYDRFIAGFFVGVLLQIPKGAELFVTAAGSVFIA